MTDRKDLKRRIRDRQAKTGESYTTARRHVLAQRPASPGAVPVVETLDISQAAAKLGLRCHVVITQTLADQLSAELVLERIHTALLVTESDPAMEVLRAIALRGEHPPGLRRSEIIALGATRSTTGELGRFFARARAGIGGVSDRGNLLALVICDVTVLCCATTWPVHHPNDRAPALFVGALDPSLVSSSNGGYSSTSDA